MGKNGLRKWSGSERGEGGWRKNGNDKKKKVRWVAKPGGKEAISGLREEEGNGKEIVESPSLSSLVRPPVPPTRGRKINTTRTKYERVWGEEIVPPPPPRSKKEQAFKRWEAL